ncbi:MAG: hypothetical protein K8R58_05260 [Bacteroidales bacterium]|nr:hypothetical protein [Bacteroidales bacterium]
MNLQRIELLIEKYFNGETSLAEENELRLYFLKENIPVHLKMYKNIFKYFSESHTEKLPDENFDKKILDKINKDQTITNNKPRRIKLYLITSVAACILLLIGLFFQFKNKNLFNSKHKIQFADTYNDPQLAYAETKKALCMISSNFNMGTKDLKKLSQFNSGMKELNSITVFETGIKNLNKLSIFNESQKLITNKN